MNLQMIRKNIGQLFCIHQAFCRLHQNQDLLDLNLVVLTNYFFFFKSTASRYIVTWENFNLYELGCIPIWLTKDIVTKTMPE